jgi:hypothetical protein
MPCGRPVTGPIQLALSFANKVVKGVSLPLSQIRSEAGKERGESMSRPSLDIFLYCFGKRTFPRMKGERV